MVRRQDRRREGVQMGVQMVQTVRNPFGTLCTPRRTRLRRRGAPHFRGRIFAATFHHKRTRSARGCEARGRVRVLPTANTGRRLAQLPRTDSVTASPPVGPFPISAGTIRQPTLPSCRTADRKTLTHPALLVVDEIGYMPVNQTGVMLFFQRSSTRRYERASTVLTSNPMSIVTAGRPRERDTPGPRCPCRPRSGPARP